MLQNIISVNYSVHGRVLRKSPVFIKAKLPDSRVFIQLIELRTSKTQVPTWNSLNNLIMLKEKILSSGKMVVLIFPLDLKL